jgi:hypothetical protein
MFFVVHTLMDEVLIYLIPPREFAYPNNLNIKDNTGYIIIISIDEGFFADL